MYLKERIKFKYCSSNYDFYSKQRLKEVNERINMKKEIMKKRRDNYILRRKLKIISVFLIVCIIIGQIVYPGFSKIKSYAFSEKTEIIPIDISKEINDKKSNSFNLLNFQDKQLEANLQLNKKEQLIEKKKVEVDMVKVETEEFLLKNPNYTNLLIQKVKNNNYGVAKININMDIDHQEYLYLLCQNYNLDFVKTLGLIGHESVYNSNAQGINKDKNGNIISIDYGYMQINNANREWLSEATNTPDAPLNPYINLEWGTYVLNSLYVSFEKEGYTGKDLDEAVWSAYNRGRTGFRKYGVKEDYVLLVYKQISNIN